MSVLQNFRAACYFLLTAWHSKCHLCNWNGALSSICMLPSLRCWAWLVIWPPVSRLSTYKLRWSSATISGCHSSQASRWALSTPQSRKGDGASRNRARVKHSVSISVCWSLLQWNLNESHLHLGCVSEGRLCACLMGRPQGMLSVTLAHPRVYFVDFVDFILGLDKGIRWAMVTLGSLSRTRRTLYASWLFPRFLSLPPCVRCKTPFLWHFQVLPLLCCLPFVPRL